MDAEFTGALDEAIFCPWARLVEEYATNEGLSPPPAPPVEAFTVELGHQELVDSEKAQEQANGLLQYLSQRGVCEAQRRRSCAKFYKCQQRDFLNIYAPEGGIILSHAPLGVELRADQPLLSLSVPDVYQKTKDPRQLLTSSRRVMKLPQSVIPINCTETAIIHEQMSLMKVMSQYRLVSSSGKPQEKSPQNQ